MNQHAKVDIRHSTCPHDCPSACALDIEVIEGRSIGRVRGSKLQTYTAGVVCAKVARYAERIHHPDRLLHPMRRTGPKGSGQFAQISWDEALDEIASRFDQAERDFGAEAVFQMLQAFLHDVLRSARSGGHQHRQVLLTVGSIVATDLESGTPALAGVAALAGSNVTVWVVL